MATLIWLACLAWVARVTIFIRQRAPGEFDAVDAAATVQILIVLATLGLLVLSRGVEKLWSKSAHTSLRLLWFYLAICFCSAIWSPQPAFSAYRAVEYFAMLTGVYVALSYARTFEQAERTVIFVTLVAVALTMAGHGRLLRPGHLFSLYHWNTTAYTTGAAMLMAYTAGEWPRAGGGRRLLLAASGFVCLLVLAVGTSTGSNIGAITGVAVAALLARSYKLVVGVALVAVVLVPLMLLSDFQSESIGQIALGGKSTEEVMSLHRRDVIWKYMFAYYLESPIMGHGFGIFEPENGVITASRPHNSVLAILVGTGVLGLIVIFTYCLRLAKELFRPARYAVIGSVGVTGAIVAGLVNSLSTPLLFNWYDESTFVFNAFGALALLWIYIPWRTDARTRSSKEHANTSRLSLEATRGARRVPHPYARKIGCASTEQRRVSGGNTH